MDIGPAILIGLVFLVIMSSVVTKPAPSKIDFFYEPYAIVTEQDCQKTKILIENYINSHLKNKLDQNSISLMSAGIVRYSQSFGLDPFLVAALIKRESCFIPQTVSVSGAIGLGQLKPEAGRDVGVVNLFDIDENVKATAAYLKKMLNLWKDNQNQVKLALASYKEGFGDVKRSGGVYSDHTAGYIADILAIQRELIKKSKN